MRHDDCIVRDLAAFVKGRLPVLLAIARQGNRLGPSRDVAATGGFGGALGYDPGLAGKGDK